SSTSADRVSTWHSRLGHPGPTTSRNIILSRSVSGLPLQQRDLQHLTQCMPCSLGKLSKVGRRSRPYRQSTTAPFSTLHIDTCGPITPPSRKYKYFMIIADVGS
ncbi:hypothetical protein DFS34DRAFT_575666, partial [Phlyctochytrium arcticum]